MRTKQISLFLPLLFFIPSVIACQTTANKGAEIACRPGFASPSFPVEGASITIAWNPNKEPGLAGYRVYYGTASGSYSSCVDIGNPSKSPSGFVEYTLTALDKGEKYYIAVIAYDKKKDTSGFSSEVSSVAK